MIERHFRPGLRRLVAAVSIVAVALAGCATASKDIAPTYASPVQYDPYDCQQLSAEAQRIQVRVVELGGRLDQAASNDKVITGVGLVLFWPALFALGGTKQQEAEYARLRGEYDAVQQMMVQKKCAMPGMPGMPVMPATVTPVAAPASAPTA